MICVLRFPGATKPVYLILIRQLRLTKPFAAYQYICEGQYMIEPSFSQRQFIQESLQYIREDNCLFVVQMMK